MKKFREVYCVLFLVVFVFTGCSVPADKETDGTVLPSRGQSAQYVVKMYGGSDSQSTDPKEQKADRLYDAQEAGMPQTLTVEFGGKQWTGEYDCGILPSDRNSRNYAVHFYDVGIEASFAVDDQGNLVEFADYSDYDEDAPTLSQEQCQQVAEEIIGDSIDRSEYQLDVELVQHGQRKHYFFEYVKHVDGFVTSDKILVIVSDKGVFESFTKEMLGKIPVDTPIPFNREEVKETIREKLDGEFADEKEIYDDVEYDFRPGTISLTKEGEYKYVISVEVNWLDGTADIPIHCCELMVFVVTMGSKM